MILNNHNTSIQIAKQLPEFIRDDVNYETFVTFLEAYYEWLQLSHTANSEIVTANSYNQGITHGSQNLLSYVDVDSTMDDFIQYFINDFLPYIPQEALTDRKKLLKISKEFYQSKGTEKSYKFLFRALYGINAELFETGDAVLKASAGKWIVPKSIRIDSADTDWLLSEGFKIFGETSKSYATIDYVLLTGQKTQLYISNIERAFESGEVVKIVDNNKKDVYFYNNKAYVQNQGYDIPSGATTLSQKIVGVVSSISIDPNYKGLLYNTGDPIIAYGGLNPDIANPVGFSGSVGEIDSGSLTSFVITNPSHGFRTSPNSTMTLIGDGTGAAAQINLIDDTKQAIINLSANTIGAAKDVVMGNTLYPQTYTNFATVGSNTNWTLANTLTFTSYTVAPIASVQVTNQGINYTAAPIAEAHSYYQTDYTVNNKNDFAFLGMLQPIQIVDAGIGYDGSDTILINGGTGFGAYANLIVDGAGSIVSVKYEYSSGNTIQTYPLGGLGYSTTSLPTVQINTSTGTGASLVVPGIMGAGATFGATTNKIGSIKTINILNSGQDYISTPNLSLRVADVAVSNVSLTYPIESGDLIFQGNDELTKTYYGYVDSFQKLVTASPVNPANDVYQIRLYNYIGSYDSTLPLKVIRTINATTDYQLVMYPSTYYADQYGNPTFIKQYGDGSARATAAFLGGLVVGQGKYLNDDGQLSSLGIVLQSIDYNSFTYLISAPKSLTTYKDLILNLVHASGTKLIGRNLISTSNNINMSTGSNYQDGNTLAYVAGSAAYATLSVDKSVLTSYSAKISSGYYHTSVIKNDGTLWTWGVNNYGQLGLENNVTQTSSPSQVGSLSTWTQIAAGYYHTLAIQSNGTLWSWGLNSWGQLGQNNQTNYSSPVQIGTSSIWTQISCGYRFTLAIQSDGTLWAWGNNSNGQLGTSNRTHYSSPVQVGALSVWTQISANKGDNSHSLAIQSGGTLWAWGSNAYGQLGSNNTQSYSSPVQVGALSIWTKISAGLNNSLTLQSNGTLWAWGYNNQSKLGLNTTTNYSSPVQIGSSSTWSQIANDNDSSLAVKYDGTLWAWGNNTYGQLGLSDLTRRSSPVQVGNLSTWILASTGYGFTISVNKSPVVNWQGGGNLWTWGTNTSGLLALPNIDTGLWKKIKASGENEGSFSLAIQSNGTLWAWGGNSFGQLGLSDLTRRYTPVQVGNLSTWTKLATGAAYTLALQSNGTLWSWGNSTQGQLGNNSKTDQSSPIQIGSSLWKEISAGYRFNLAIQSNGTLWAWGDNFYSNLGNNTTTLFSSPIQVGSSSLWTQIAAGGIYSLALQSDGTLWAWGYNGFGNLGTSDTTTRSTPVQIGALSNWTQIAAGFYHSLAIQSDGTLWAWGGNSFGQLGLSDRTHRSSPIQVGGLSVWTQLSTVYSHSAALQSNGTVWTWGLNTWGQLGLGDKTNRSSPVQAGSASTWTQIGFGQTHFLGIQSNGSMWSWGKVFGGQLGNQEFLAQNMVFQYSPSANVIPLYDVTSQRYPNQVGTLKNWASVEISPAIISNNIIKLTNVIAGNIGNTIFANDIIEFTATNNIRAYSMITLVDWVNNQVYMQDNVFLTFPNVAIASVNTTSNVINIDTMTGQYDGNFGTLSDITPMNVIVSVGDTVSFGGDGTYYTVTKLFANGNFSIDSTTVGPIDNVYITINKNANTQSVMIYGDVSLYGYPELVTETLDSLMTEAGAYILIG
jgi:alpha-tubulin suppressor-like RCC1 family protein